MGDLASLLPGIASIITALGGVYLGHRALKSGSRRERRAAAQRVIDRALGDDEDQDDDEDDRHAAREQLLELLRRELEQEGGDR